MNIELFINILNIVSAFGSNNWLSAGISVLIFIYNLYLKLRKRSLMSLVFDSQKENKSAGSRVSMIFKIKFIIYTIVSMYALCMAILHFFDDMEYKDYFKIFNREETDSDYY